MHRDRWSSKCASCGDLAALGLNEASLPRPELSSSYGPATSLVALSVRLQLWRREALLVRWLARLAMADIVVTSYDVLTEDARLDRGNKEPSSESVAYAAVAELLRPYTEADKAAAEAEFERRTALPYWAGLKIVVPSRVAGPPISPVYSESALRKSPLQSVLWHRIVLDEVQMIEGSAGAAGGAGAGHVRARAKMAQSLQATARWCVSGVSDLALRAHLPYRRHPGRLDLPQ